MSEPAADLSYRGSFARFSRGDREAALAGLHQRSRLQRFRPPALRDLPCWEGEEERSVLIWAPEGIGIGAEILHLGFLPDLARVRPALAVSCDPRLARRLRRAVPGIDIRPTGSAPPEGIDAQASLLSLGHLSMRLFGETRRAPRLFGASRAGVTALRSKLSPDGRPLVGFSWMTTNARWRGSRDLPEAVALALLDAEPGWRFVDLQHGSSDSRREPLVAAGLSLDPVFDPVADFDGLLDRIAAMDAVVTIDNTVAYAAGALMKRGVVVLGESHSWPWDAPAGWWYRSLVSMRDDPAASPTRRAAAIAGHLRAMSGFPGVR